MRYKGSSGFMKNSLKYYRNKRKITQIEFAERIGISRRSYQYYEAGLMEPKIKIAKKMSIELGIPIEKVFPD